MLRARKIVANTMRGKDCNLLDSNKNNGLEYKIRADVSSPRSWRLFGVFNFRLCFIKQKIRAPKG